MNNHTRFLLCFLYVASNVAECITYGEATGTTPNDVGLLYEVLNAVEPTMKPEEAQNYIRWAGTELSIYMTIHTVH